MTSMQYDQNIIFFRVPSTKFGVPELWTAVSCWAKKRRSEWFHLVCHPTKSDIDIGYTKQVNGLNEMCDRIKWIKINFNRKVLCETDHEDGRMFPLSTRPARYLLRNKKLL